MTRHQDHIRVGFGDAGGDGAHTGFSHEFHANFGPRVDLLEVVNQLGEVLDAVDVVMRGRRDRKTSCRERVCLYV